MSELKRVTLSSIGDNKKSTNSSIVSASKTIRLDLNLFEPNADSFPEFNYSKLLHVEKKKKKKISKINGFADPFEENDDDVTRIAKEFERKYGNAYAGKKGANRPNNDYCDKGAGYDDNDDFIDNTEAYDEIIPDELEAYRGGFYINSGALEFTNLPNFERPEDAMRMPKPKKRHLSTTSDSSASESESDKKSSLKNGHLEKKPKILNDKEKDVQKPISKDKKNDKVKLKDKKEDGAGSDSGKDNKKMIKTTTVKDMLRAKRDNMRNMNDNGSKSEQTEESEKETSSSDDSDSSDEEQSKKEHVNVNGTSQRLAGDIKLPDNLPTDLLQYINKITEASKTTNAGKNNFFDATNMDLLYKIDMAARAKGGSIRNQIYNYLEEHLPCTKQTILMRAKKIRIQKEEAKTNKILNRLKVAVDIVMPDVLSNHEAECKRISELRASVNATANVEKSEQQFKNPKKRFPWNDSIRNLLYELVNVRKQSFNVIKPRKETADDFVNKYLNENVIKIWPDGWIKLEDLHKEYDKRKAGSAKNPKENKKPDENAVQTIAKEKPQIVQKVTPSLNLNNNNIPTKPVTKDAKSILSTSNSVSPIIKDTKPSLVSQPKGDVKIDSTHSEQTIPVPLPAPSFGSCLTITPIGANDLTSKPLPTVQNKVIITNVESLAKPPQTSSTSTNTISSIHQSKETVTPVSNHSSTKTNSNSNKIIKLTSPSDYISPPKKSTDHSINSIISSALNNHSTNSETGASNENTTIIDLDNPKSKSDIFNAISQNISNSTECSIKIRSVATVNSVVENTNVVKPSVIPDKITAQKLPNNNPKVIPQPIIQEIDSSSSDDVEFIDVSPMNTLRLTRHKRKSLLSVNKSKYKKSNTNSSRSSSPQISNTNLLSHSKPISHIVIDDMKRKADSVLPAAPDSKDGDFDVNQIMKELKELQEMQTSASSIHSSDINSSHHKSSLSRSSALTYNKKFDHSEHSTQLNRSSS